MKKVDLGQTVSMLANIGVIAGIIFLAVELRQNNALLDSQATAASTQIRIAAQELIIGDYDVAGMIAKRRRGEPLSDEESIALGFYYSTAITGMQYSFQEFSAGRVRNEPVGSRTWHLAFDTEQGWPGLLEYWEARRGMYDAQFTAWMDENVVYQKASPESDWWGVLKETR